MAATGTRGATPKSGVNGVLLQDHARPVVAEPPRALAGIRASATILHVSLTRGKDEEIPVTALLQQDRTISNQAGRRLAVVASPVVPEVVAIGNSVLVAG